MSIWFNPDVTTERIQPLCNGTLGGYIGIVFTEIGDNYIKAKMPVDERTRQPYGLLHGGASAALAETLGSIASAMVVNLKEFDCVGLEINANHIRGVREGYVYATVLPLHIGRSTHVWEIRIVDSQEQLVCVSRLTVAVLAKKS